MTQRCPATCRHRKPGQARAPTPLVRCPATSALSRSTGVSAEGDQTVAEDDPQQRDAANVVDGHDIGASESPTAAELEHRRYRHRVKARAAQRARPLPGRSRELWCFRAGSSTGSGIRLRSRPHWRLEHRDPEPRPLVHVPPSAARSAKMLATMVIARCVPVRLSPRVKGTRPLRWAAVRAEGRA